MHPLAIRVLAASAQLVWASETTDYWSLYFWVQKIEILGLIQARTIRTEPHCNAVDNNPDWTPPPTSYNQWINSLTSLQI